MTAVSGPDRWLNGYLVFDYYSENDYKIVGMNTGQNEWVLKHFLNGNSSTLFRRDWDDYQRTIDADTTYKLDIQLRGRNYYITINGELLVQFSFNNWRAGGQVGVASINGVTRFDNFSVTLPPQAFLLTLCFQCGRRKEIVSWFETITIRIDTQKLRRTACLANHLERRLPLRPLGLLSLVKYL
ncbi:MAG: hypothetical protein R3C11_24390 [Planctomycetaceae bacterium]